MINNKHLESPVTIDVSWEQKASDNDNLDLTAFLLNKNGQVSDFSDMVFYGTTKVVDMKLTSTKHPNFTIETKYNKRKKNKSQCMTIDLENLPEEIVNIVFVVSCEDGKPLYKFKKKIILRDKKKSEVNFEIEDDGDNVFCVSVGDLQKKNKRWTLVKEQTCYAGGLEKAYEDFVPINIRKEQPTISKFKRPVIPITKGPMPSTTPKENGLEGKPTEIDTPNPQTLGHPSGIMPRSIKQPKVNEVNKETGHGTMPKTTRRKEKTENNSWAILKGKVSIKEETTVSSNKVANMANRFANKKK